MVSTLKKILIAEDEKPIAHALQLKLEHGGFATKNVYNGEEAIEALRKEKFDFVLLDLIMPKKDGFAVLEEIKNLKLKIKIIVLSNLAQEEDLKRAKILGASNYFVKANTPISNIVEEVKKII